MPKAAVDDRSPERHLRDEQIAAEPLLPPMKLPPDAVPLPLETHLKPRQRQPLALLGVVENGLVRPLDPTVTLPENMRVIIVAAKE
jgi:hypothetical protein